VQQHQELSETRLDPECHLVALLLAMLSVEDNPYSHVGLPASFRRRAFSEVVLSIAAPDRSIYRSAGVSRVEQRSIKFTSDVASRSFVLSGGGLSSREPSRLFGVVIGGGVVGGVEVGIRGVE
jgi:hypothetical protein